MADEDDELLEFAFPGLKPVEWHLEKQPYAYVLTEKEGKYISTFPTLKHVSNFFCLKSYLVDLRKFLISAVWADNRAYFVPYELLSGPNEELLFPDDVPEHYLERDLEDYLVMQFWRNEALISQGKPIERSVADDSGFNYDYPPEYIPRIGWVSEKHPMHSESRK